jgi:carboxypeptidase family protein
MTGSLSHGTDAMGGTGRDVREGQAVEEAEETGEEREAPEAPEASLTIRGRVRDSLGVALPRAVVTLSATSGGRRLAKTRSAADGAFTVTAPAHGDYQLVAFSPQLGSQSVTVQLTGRPVEVEFRIDVPGTVAH